MGSNKDDIKPINLKNEKEFANEFSKISLTLENPNNEWTKRLDAIKSLQGMMIGSTCTHELFLPNFIKLYPYLNIQLKDLRSAVQKEACKLLSLGAENLQRSFEQIGIKFLTKDSLLSIINSGNKMLCENAHSCVQSIIEFCPSSSYLGPILEECQSKSQQVRSRVSQYLMQVMIQMNPPQLERYAQQLDSCIQKGVQDANAEVRQNFRGIFSVYRKMYPSKAERIFANIDSSIKKLLQDDNNNNNNGDSTPQYNQRLMQQKSVELNSASQSSSIKGTQSSVQISNNDDSHYHFTSISNTQSTTSKNQSTKTPSNLQQKGGNIIMTSSVGSSSTSQNQVNISSSSNHNNNNNSSNNNLNKSRNGSSHLSQERAIVNNLKSVQNTIASHSNKESRKMSPQKQIQRESISPMKKMEGNSNSNLPPQPETSKQFKSVQGVQRYNNFQDIQGRALQKMEGSEGENKIQSYKSQDHFVHKKNQNQTSLKEEEKTSKPRTNTSLTRPPQSGEGTRDKLGSIPMIEKRNSQNDENQIQSSDKNKSYKSQPSKTGVQKQQQSKQIEKPNKKNVQKAQEMDEGDYELYRRRSFEENEEEIQEEERQKYRKEDEFDHYNNDFEQDEYDNDGEIEDESYKYEEKRIREEDERNNIKYNNGYKSNASKVANTYNKVQEEDEEEDDQRCNRQKGNSSSSNNNLRDNEQKNWQSKSKQPQQQAKSSQAIKLNNFVDRDTEEQYMRMSAPLPEEDDQFSKKQITKDDSVNSKKYLNNFQNKQKQMNKSSNNKFINQPEPPPQVQQNTFSWREEDLELLLDKAGNQVNWSTRASAFDSIKEVISEMNNGRRDIEKISPSLMKRIVNAHIEHLSDSHFKVTSACLDSLIPLLSYDIQYLIPKLDDLVLKVLNNLIDTKDQVSSKANFLVNLLSKIFPGEKLIEPILKVLEQTNKNLLKICSLEVLMVTVKGAEDYYSQISNVRHTIQLMCMIIQENSTQKQLALPALGIVLSLRDHNPQATLHSILSLTNQNQITALRSLAYEYAQDLEEDLRKYVQKENIKPTEKISKSNIRQFQVEQGNYSLLSANPSQSAQIPPKNLIAPSPSSSSSSQQNQQQLQQQSIPSQNLVNEKLSSQQLQQALQPQSQNRTFDLNNLDSIFECVDNFEDNKSFIIQQINGILLSTIQFFKSTLRKQKDLALRVLSSLFLRDQYYLTIQPNTVYECLSIYSFIPKDMDFYQINEIIDEMIDCVPHLIFMKALVEKLNTEKPPQLQTMIKKISFILRKASKEEIRPFLDHITDSFKISINDQSPEVRKSVVFCLVDLKFLMEQEVDPYLYQFTGNQQKLVDIYIKKRQQENGEPQE